MLGHHLLVTPSPPQGVGPRGDDHVEPKAGNRHVLVAPGERVSLLLADPLGKAVWILVVRRMPLVQGEVVVARASAEGRARGIDAGSQADATDSQCRRGVEHVV